MIHRIFLEFFKSKSPSSKYSQDHETEHRSVFPISVKGPYSNPPIREWSIPCLRLPLVNFEQYRDIRSPPPCNLFHQSVSCFFIRQNELPLFQTRFVPFPSPSPFPSTTLAHQGALFSLSPLFLSRGGDPAHLSLKTRMKSQLHSQFITPPIILFWRKLCMTLSY